MNQTMADHQGVVLIGDVVASRSHPDRRALQERVFRVLEDTAADVPGLQRLAVTVGDEFQGVFAELATAVRAALLVRLSLLPEVDTRYGLGSGPFMVFDDSRQPISQDGPAWWAAREAITTAKQRSDRPRSRSTRLWYVAATPNGAPADLGAGPVNAYLSCCDELLGRMSPRELRLTRGVVQGVEQAELAEREGVVPSAVSQALSRSGAHTVAASLHLLATGGRP
ncbi:SatD family protein [Blastococcus sp. TF02-9]|uniref:SatD family protein n=1 Tax=Blastococcus sp. TF02-09 TaxID=2250576 RepID=UPI001F442C69|nr:SatD family protein [Blastococcus sp. TF02-9]